MPELQDRYTAYMDLPIDHAQHKVIGEALMADLLEAKEGCDNTMEWRELKNMALHTFLKSGTPITMNVIEELQNAGK